MPPPLSHKNETMLVSNVAKLSYKNIISRYVYIRVTQDIALETIIGQVIGHVHLSEYTGSAFFTENGF